jgi:hypothetical protein
MTQNANNLPEQEGLIPLPIPVPPSLEGVLGYGGEARYLALWWVADADEAMWSDGRTTTDGWQGFLAYVQHPKVGPYLEPYDLVSSEEPAAYYLLLDLVGRQAYIGTARQVTRFLHNYTPRPDLTSEQGEMLTQVMRERPFAINHDAMERELEFRSLALQAMLEELESHF